MRSLTFLKPPTRVKPSFYRASKCEIGRRTAQMSLSSLGCCCRFHLSLGLVYDGFDMGSSRQTQPRRTWEVSHPRTISVFFPIFFVNVTSEENPQNLKNELAQILDPIRSMFLLQGTELLESR